MTDHLSTEQITSYRERRTQPEELLRVDDHISHCAECRQRLASAVDLRAALQSTLGEDGGAVPAEAIPRTHHLAYEQLEAYVDGKLSSADRNNAQTHLEICQICSEELRDLHTFKIELAASQGQTKHGWLARLSALWLTRRRVALGLAMAAVIVLTVEVARWRLAPAPELPSARTPKTYPTAKETFAAINNLSPEEQSAVRDAISQQRINSPAVLAGLHGKRQTLLGESHEAARFEVLRPLGEVVPEVRPVFRWQPLTGASSYSVAIFDTNLNPVQFSPPLGATHWTADRPLKRGRMYLWQVTARLRDGKSFSAPSPPNPEAKFRVLDQKKADEFDRLQALEHALSSIPSESHLVHGILYAQAGLFDMGEKELILIPESDSNYGLAQKLLKSIQEIRNSTR